MSDVDPTTAAGDPVGEPLGDPGLRTLHRLTAGGLSAAVAAAVLVGVLGGTGVGGLAVLVLLASLTSALVGLVGVIGLARDDARGRPVGRARIVWTVCGFAGATLLLAMLVGLGG